MANFRRATFRNPNHICSFNSLTQCLYNVELFRRLVLSFDLTKPSNIPSVLQLPTLAADNLPPKVKTAVNYSKDSSDFVCSYIEIFRQMHNPDLCLDLSDCVQNLEDASGCRFLLPGPSDPNLEFMAIVRNFSLADRVFMCQMLTPYTNPFVKLFGIMTSSDFENPARSVFLQVSNRSSIFGIETDGFYYNFTKSDNPPNVSVIHSLPDVLCVHFVDPGRYDKKELQLTLDLRDFVFDKSKRYVYRMNSFVIMLSEVHAIAYVRSMAKADTGNETWLVCNDSVQETLDWAQLDKRMQACGPERRAIVCLFERAD
jgi:hypothetical protein